MTSLFTEAVEGLFEDGCFFLAKAASYSAALCIFPGLIFLTALLFSGNAEQVVEDLSLAMGEVLPPEVHRLLTAYLGPSARTSTAALLFTGTAALLFASDLMRTLMEGFRNAYGVKTRDSMLHEFGVSLVLALLSILPLGLVNVALILSRQIEAWAVQLLGRQWWIVESFRFGWWGIQMGTAIVTLSVLYYLAPNRKQRLRDVWIGAAMAAALWSVSTGLFTFYVQNVARYRDLYGNIYTVIVLLIWTYLCVVIVFFGCEFNAARERRLGTLPARRAET